MGRQRTFKIKESKKTLNALKPSVTTYNSAQRLDCLRLIKSRKYNTLEEVATHLDIHISTLQRWLLVYREQGISKLLEPETRKKKSKIITAEIHKELEHKLLGKGQPFSGYVEVQQWLSDTYDININYQWLWKYLRTKMDSQLKAPRKHSVKKNLKAGQILFKTIGGYNLIRNNLTKHRSDSANLYYGDESRFGLKSLWDNTTPK